MEVFLKSQETLYTAFIKRKCIENEQDIKKDLHSPSQRM